jgi:type I site-specific restriction-modification system R (restriction) subunit
MWPSSRRCGQPSPSGPGEQRTAEELDHAIRQIVSRAIAPEGVVDLFAAAGLKKPDIPILSDEFPADVRGLPQKNLAVEVLRKLLEGEVNSRCRTNLVQARSFAELLEQAIRRYQNRAVEAAQGRCRFALRPAASSLTSTGVSFQSSLTRARQKHLCRLRG